MRLASAPPRLWPVTQTFFPSDASFSAYLFAYAFWLGLGLGSLGMLFIQFLTGGVWGLVTRRIFEAAAATLPLMAILFLPVLFGLPNLYLWAGRTWWRARQSSSTNPST